MGEVTFRNVLMTPEWARQLLATNIDRNRSLRQLRWKQYSRMMSEGRWKANTGEPIGIDTKGRLVNGQHRLMAVVDSGVSVMMTLAEGIDPDAFDVIDSGLPRSMGDMLRSDGHQYANLIAATAKLTLGYETRSLGSARYDEISLRTSIHDEATRYAETYRFACAQADGWRRQLRGLNASAASTYCILVQRRYEEFDPFATCERIVTGNGLEIGDPRLSLRNWITNAHSGRGRGMKNTDHLAVFIRAHNALATDRTLQTIVPWRRGEPFPLLIGDK